MERLTTKINGNYCLNLNSTNEEDAKEELKIKFKLAMNKLGQIENFLEDYNLTIEEISNSIKHCKVNIIELNGLLTDCIIDITNDIYDDKILNLFEDLSNNFYEKLLITFGEI